MFVCRVSRRSNADPLIEELNVGDAVEPQGRGTGHTYCIVTFHAIFYLSELIYLSALHHFFVMHDSLKECISSATFYVSFKDPFALRNN